MNVTFVTDSAAPAVYGPSGGPPAVARREIFNRGVTPAPPLTELSVNCERNSVTSEFCAKIAPPSAPLACWWMSLLPRMPGCSGMWSRSPTPCSRMPRLPHRGRTERTTSRIRLRPPK